VQGKVFGLTTVKYLIQQFLLWYTNWYREQQHLTGIGTTEMLVP